MIPEVSGMVPGVSGMVSGIYGRFRKVRNIMVVVVLLAPRAFPLFK